MAAPDLEMVVEEVSTLDVAAADAVASAESVILVTVVDFESLVVTAIMGSLEKKKKKRKIAAKRVNFVSLFIRKYNNTKNSITTCIKLHLYKTTPF